MYKSYQKSYQKYNVLNREQQGNVNVSSNLILVVLILIVVVLDLDFVLVLGELGSEFL